MKTNLGIKNFRVFDENGVEFKLKPITFLTGCNSSGKSSMVKAILFLQSYLKHILEDYKAGKKIKLEDYKVNLSTSPLNSLGGFDKVANRKSGSSSVTIEYTTYSKMLSHDVTVSMTFNSLKADSLNNAYLDSLRISLDEQIFFSTSRESSTSCNLNIIKSKAKEFIIIEDLLKRREALGDRYDDSYYYDDDEGVVKEESEIIKNGLSHFSQERINEVSGCCDYSVRTRPIKDIDWQINNESLFHLDLIEKCEGKTKAETIDYLESIFFHFNHLDTLDRGALKRIILLFSRSSHETLKSFCLEYERKFLETQERNSKFEFEWNQLPNGLKSSINLAISQRSLYGREDDCTGMFDEYTNPFERMDTIIDVCGSEVTIETSEHMDEIKEAMERIESLQYTLTCPESPDFKFFYSVLTQFDNMTYGELIDETPNDWGTQTLNYKYYYFKERYTDTWDGLFYHYMAEAMEKFVERLVAESLTPDWSDKISYVSSSRVDVQRLYTLDKQDDFTKLINRYFDARRCYEEHSSVDGYAIGTFVQKWCQKLGIGDNLELSILPDGIGAQIKVIDSDNPEGVLLSYEGYGLTQLMSILLQIETEILSGRKGTIIIEEPEIHLHPRLQSLLTDMFYEAYKEYGIHFIIETHSEYMIRKSQALVKQMNFDTNDVAEEKSPFRTYYMPENGEKPYSLGYRKDGKFKEDFGPGFFDEAANLTFEIL